MKGTEQCLLRGLEQFLSRRHVAAADEDGGVLQVLRTAREDAAMDEVADVILGNATATHHHVRTAVVRDDLVEHAGET